MARLTTDQLTELSNRLLSERKRVEQVEEQLEVQRRTRDEAIIAASKAGMSRRLVADLAGVSAGRVQQVVTGEGEGNPFTDDFRPAPAPVGGATGDDDIPF